MEISTLADHGLQWGNSGDLRRITMNCRRLFYTYSLASCLFLIVGLTTPELAMAQNSTEPTQSPSNLDPTNDDRLLIVIVALLLVQTLLIGGLQRSRIKYKEAKDNLKRSQKALEQRVVERTNKLRTINNQLYEEIARHEITEELLQETQDYLHSMINSMPSVLIGVTREGTVTQWNSAAERATDINAEHALGKNITELSSFIKIDLETVRNAIDQGATQIKEAVQGEDNGQLTYADWIIYPLLSTDIAGAVIRIDDVTMRVRFENMMIQNEKMMSLGELAAGMAHEINNPLSAILHGVQNIYRRTAANLPTNLEIAEKHNISLEQLQGYLEERGIYKFIADIREAGERSAHIVTNMLEFSRTSTRKHTPVNLIELMEHSVELATNSFDLQHLSGAKRLDIQRDYAARLPLVPCSAAEIQQVFINIIRNAAQAFQSWPKQGKDRPWIKLSMHANENNVVIRISDNGPGMTDITKRHLFEPFFTTKEVGKGTGLGLSVSYFIITEHHDGQIEVESQQGRGSTFIITLPISIDQSVDSDKTLEQA
jgi:PAS domain S-box-containing protein